MVLDNLSTHSPAALYERFEPAEARRILSRIEFHFTPKHASWLNMVEIEIVMVRQCLDRRIADMSTLTWIFAEGGRVTQTPVQRAQVIGMIWVLPSVRYELVF